MNDRDQAIPLMFTGYRAFEAEGARMGIYSCYLCGAALVLDPDHDFGAIHAAWHAGIGPGPDSEENE